MESRDQELIKAKLSARRLFDRVDDLQEAYIRGQANTDWEWHQVFESMLNIRVSINNAYDQRKNDG